MIAKKIHVGDKKSIKLTKCADCLEGSINRLCKFLEENPNCKSDIVLLAGTNDLRKHQSSAESLAASLVDQGWIGYMGTHVPMFVHKLGLIKPRQT